MKAKKTIFFILLFTTLTILCYAADAVGDYRSLSTGQWAPTVEFPAMNWQICTVAGDPGTWVTASTAPDSLVGVITIRNGHIISIIENQTADQIVVEAGGRLIIYNNQVLTLKNDLGIDLDIKSGGYLSLLGNIVTQPSTTVQISGSYDDEENCQIQGWGAVTLASDATCKTQNAFGIYLFGSPVRGCFAVADRTMSNGANYAFNSNLNSQQIYALPSIINNLIASNDGIDEKKVTLKNALSANNVTITTGALTLGGATSLNSLALNSNALNFNSYYAYFNNQHFSVGGKYKNVTAFTIAEDVVTTYDMGGDYGTSIPRTWTVSATQSGLLNIIMHYPEDLTTTAKVNVWTRDSGTEPWTLYGKYTPTTANGMKKVTITNLASLNNSTDDGERDWTISDEEPPPLPVELSSFSAAPMANGFMKIKWTTQSETGVLGFYIFRGTTGDLNSSRAISSILAATNSSQEVNYDYLDAEIPGYGTYYYWLQNVDIDGTEYFNGPITVTLNNNNYTPPPVIPSVTSLNNIFPNPFNPNTMVSYNMSKAGNVTIVVYNTKGELIRKLFSGSKQAGSYQQLWDGKDESGQSQPSGVYFVKMTSGKYTETQKAILLK